MPPECPKCGEYHGGREECKRAPKGEAMTQEDQRLADALKIARDNLADAATSDTNRFSQRWAHEVFQSNPDLVLVPKDELERMRATIAAQQKAIEQLLAEADLL